jgi:hypothetical protein
VDPLTANLVLVAAPAALLLLAVTIILFRRGRRASTGELTTAESIVISIVGGGAMLNALGCLLRLWSEATWVFSIEPFHVTDLHYQGATPPELLDGVDHIAASGYESVWMDVMGLPAESRWLFYAELVLPVLGALAISVAVAWLSFTLVRERPFVRAFPISIGIAAIAVMVGGIGSQFAGALARSTVIEYLGESHLVGDNTTAPAYDVLTFFWLPLDLAPVGWAFGLALVAAAFQIGTRLQRESDLLV